MVRFDPPSPQGSTGAIYTAQVTLASSELGLWNPFSWYPYVPPSKWAAIVTDATSTDTVATLVDRGYGWIYLTSEGLS